MQLAGVKQLADRESGAEIDLRKFFDRLNSDTNSVLCGTLSPAKSVAGKISRGTFNKAVGPILASSIMSRLDEDKRYELIQNYFQGLVTTLGNVKLLIKASYFESFCAVFEDVVSISIFRHKNVKLQSLQDVLGALGNVNLAEMVTGGKTKLTKNSIVPVLKNALSGQMPVNEEMV